MRIQEIMTDSGSGRRTAVLDPYCASDLMTGNVVTVAETDTVRRAANLMRGRSIGCLPVTRGGRLVGIVTASDLLVLLGRGIDRPRPSRQRNLQHRGPHKHKSQQALASRGCNVVVQEDPAGGIVVSIADPRAMF